MSKSYLGDGILVYAPDPMPRGRTERDSLLEELAYRLESESNHE